MAHRSSGPTPTHGAPDSLPVREKERKPWRTAAECINWELPGKSIFGRDRPLAHNTMRRIAKGAWKHVLANPRPYIVGAGGSVYAGKPVGVDQPFGTFKTDNHRAVVQPVLAPFIGDQSRPLNATTAAANSPLRTQCANVKGGHFTLTAAALLPLRGTTEGHLDNSRELRDLMTTISASGTHHALAMAHFEQANGGFYEGTGRPADAPLSTITTAGSNQQLVTAYFVKYYGNERDGISMHGPIHTIPTKDRFALVEAIQVPLSTLAPEHRERAKQCADLLREHLPEHFKEPADMVVVSVDGTGYVLVDFTLRMLQPPELYRGQGFPLSYITAFGIDPFTGKRIVLTLTAQVRMCGNSVSPPVAAALVRANYSEQVVPQLEQAVA
jgi:DNA (cytosine-5)-methyltransferase 1